MMMEKKAPDKSRKRRFWWWTFFIGMALGLFGFFWMAEVNHQGPEEEETTPLVEDQGDPAAPTLDQESPLQEAVTAETAEAPVDPCVQCEKDVRDFLNYLDQKKYVRDLLQDEDAYSGFKRILSRLGANPPIPSGEGSPMMMAGNAFHLFRVLKGRDLRLIKEVISREKETLEIQLETFYRWMEVGRNCPEANLRPSPDAAYDYAGFFLSTIGGRAYLFRRDTKLRLLLSYYSIMIISEADAEGRNTYGIDIMPLIPPLLDELNHYPDFLYQSRYVQDLTRVREAYQKERGSLTEKPAQRDFAVSHKDR